MLHGYRIIVYTKKMKLIDIVENVEARFDTPNYELDGSLPKGKNKK